MKKAFTLLEVIVASLILSIVVAGVFLVFNSAHISWQMSTGELDLQQYARLTMDGMVKHLREARAITVSSDGKSLQFDDFDYLGLVYTLDAENKTVMLVRQVFDEDLETTVPVASVVSPYIGSLDFCWSHGADPCTVVRGDSRVLRIQLEASQDVMRKDLTFPWVEEVRLRND